MKLRRATLDDLDTITDLMVSTMPMDPLWDYQFPYRREFPQDHWEYIRDMVRPFFHKDHFVVNIVIDEDTDVRPRKMVSVAVWEICFEKTETKDLPRTEGLEGLPQVNPKHIAAFKSACSAASEKYFNSVYGERRVQLQILGVHPDYQGQGIGTQQCRWGMEYAEAHSVPATVLASPMGERLYRSLGFRLITHTTVQAEGEEEKHPLGVLVLDSTPQIGDCTPGPV